MNQNCRCPSCRRVFRVPEDVIGKVSHCPRCRAELRLQAVSGQTTVSLAAPVISTAGAPTETLADLPAAAATAATAFDFQPPVEPIIRLERPRRRATRHPYSVPIWGAFLLLLITFLAGAGWGGWRLYDSQVRQPRYREIRRLYNDWEASQIRLPYDSPKTRRREEEAARQLDQIARERYGVPAKDLLKLLPN